MALVNPVVGFNFKADGRELLNFKPENKSSEIFLNRIRNLMGSSFADEAIKIKFDEILWKIVQTCNFFFRKKAPAAVLSKVPT